VKRARSIALALALGAGCADAPRPGRAKTAPPAPVVERPRPRPAPGQRGKATYYSNRFQGRKTASGERYDRRQLTAAHRSLPFGSLVKVTNRLNGRSVVVRVNDRGPFGRGRVIDVSEAAARELDMMRAGVVPVTVEVVRRGAP
jgi:rare lipoprotein A